MRLDLPWRFGQLKDENQDNQSKKDLERDRKSPSCLTVDEGAAKVDPIRNANSTRNESSFDHNKLSSSVRFRAFRLPRGYGRGIKSIPDTRYKSANDQVRQAEGGCL